MYSGIGGMRLGLEKANDNHCSCLSEESKQKECKKGGKWDSDEREVQFCTRQNATFRCIWANDNDKYACQIYRKHYGDKELVEGDIRTIDSNAIPDFELLTAGFPCQSFSLAGKRRGFEDTRGTLFYEVARIAEAKRPKLLLLENVKGLLSNDEGRTFAKIIQTLDELGYLVEWQVLNSKHFGVPQNRERVFIVGHLRGTSTRQIFPIGEASEVSHGKAKGQSESGEASTLEATYGKAKSLSNMVSIYDGHHKQFTEKMGTLTGRENRQGTNWLVIADRTRSYANLGRNLESPKPHTNALSSVGKDNLVLLSHTKANIRQRSQNRNDTWTLDQTSSKMAFIEGQRIRRLTPTECERLQGFPDGWTEGVSDTQRYKLLGNAVTTNVIAFLGEKLKGCIE